MLYWPALSKSIPLACYSLQKPHKQPKSRQEPPKGRRTHAKPNDRTPKLSFNNKAASPNTKKTQTNGENERENFQVACLATSHAHPRARIAAPAALGPPLPGLRGLLEGGAGRHRHREVQGAVVPHQVVCAASNAGGKGGGRGWEGGVVGLVKVKQVPG